MKSKQYAIRSWLLGACTALATLTIMSAHAAERGHRNGEKTSTSDSSAQGKSDSLAASAPPNTEADAPRVRITTSEGAFVVALYPQRAPLSTANFLRYVNEGFYTNTLIHRVVGNFIVQGGGYSATDSSMKATHDSVPNESGNGLRNVRGTFGLARSEAPHSGNAEFYINIADNPDLDPVPTRWGYAVFGRVVEGMDVVDRIGTVPTGKVGPFKSDSPLKPIVIEKVERLAPAR